MLFDLQIYTKVEAVRHMYEAVGLGFLWKWTKLPLIEPRVDSIYLWFAKNRLWLTGRNNQECEENTCDLKFKDKSER